MNLKILDAGRYVPDDNWFTRRLEDIRSIQNISYNESMAAYERLTILNDEQFRNQLYKVAASSMSWTYGEDYGDLINPFILSLSEYRPAGLSELDKRIASSLKGENVRSELFKKLTINSWILLLSAIEQNSEMDTSRNFKDTFIEALGGSGDFGAMLVFNHYKAIVSGDLDEALLSVKLAATANRLFSYTLPEYVSLMATLNDKRVEAFMTKFEDFAETYRVDLILSVIYSYTDKRSEHFDHFDSFVKQELGLDDVEFEELAHDILYLQLGRSDRVF